MKIMRKITRSLAAIGIDGFLALLLLSIFLAYLHPATGAGTGAFSLSSIANYLISFIFFFYGLKLSKGKFKQGLANTRLHLLIHSATFLLFPLLAFVVKPFFSGEQLQTLWLGIFYLATLPSTVSSSVVMVSIAKGNIPAAIFNASLSSLTGVFITPLWMSLVLVHAGGFEAAALIDIILKLILQILVPVVLGMLLNKVGGRWAEKHDRQLKWFDQSVILLIVYTSFCESFEEKIFDNFPLPVLLLTAVGMVALFFLVYGIITLFARWFKFNREDTITAQFCGSKKSLVHGTAMSKVIFPGYAGVGILLLPIMIYHALQLMIVTAIARKKGKATETETNG